MYKERCEELETLTKRLINKYVAGEYEEWFAALHKDCVWVGSGEPTLMGASNIIAHFDNYHPDVPMKLISENYIAVPLSAKIYIVTGQYIIGSDLAAPSAAVQFSIAYRYVGTMPKLAYQHMSYDFIRKDVPQLTPATEEPGKPAESSESAYLLDATSRLYIRELLIGKSVAASIPIQVGTQHYYINPNNIIYLQSDDHRTNIYCVDNVINASMSFTELANIVPASFCKVRRGCMVNPIFITAIRRSEVELVFRTTISIPVPNYTKVKKELEDKMSTK